MKKINIILILLHITILFFPLFGCDLEISYITGMELLKQPLYLAILIVLVLSIIFNNFKYSKLLIIIGSLLLICYEIYFAFTWYILNIMEFNVTFAVENMRLLFYLLIIIDLAIVIVNIRSKSINKFVE